MRTVNLNSYEPKRLKSVKLEDFPRWHYSQYKGVYVKEEIKEMIRTDRCECDECDRAFYERDLVRVELDGVIDYACPLCGSLDVRIVFV